MTPAFALNRQQRPVIATNVMQLGSELHHILTLAFVSTVTQHCHCNINQQLFVWNTVSNVGKKARFCNFHEVNLKWWGQSTRPNSTITKLTTSLCSMSLHQQHKLQQEKKVDELGSKSLFLAAEVSSPIYSTFHACSRRKHHIFSISLGIYSPVSCKNIHRH